MTRLLRLVGLGSCWLPLCMTACWTVSSSMGVDANTSQIGAYTDATALLRIPPRDANRGFIEEMKAWGASPWRIGVGMRLRGGAQHHEIGLNAVGCYDIARDQLATCGRVSMLEVGRQPEGKVLGALSPALYLEFTPYRPPVVAVEGDEEGERSMERMPFVPRLAIQVGMGGDVRWLRRMSGTRPYGFVGVGLTL